MCLIIWVILVTCRVMFNYFPTLRSDRFIKACPIDDHYNDTMMSAMASHITAFSGADRRKHQRSASLPSVSGIHRRMVDSPHKGQYLGRYFYLIKYMFVQQNQCHNCSWVQGISRYAFHLDLSEYAVFCTRNVNTFTHNYVSRMCIWDSQTQYIFYVLVCFDTNPIGTVLWHQWMIQCTKRHFHMEFAIRW